MKTIIFNDKDNSDKSLSWLNKGRDNSDKRLWNIDQFHKLIYKKVSDMERRKTKTHKRP